MKKLAMLFLALSIVLFACKNNSENKNGKSRAETKLKSVSDSLISYRMIKVENKSPEETAKAFKSYLEEQGMYYPKFLDFHRAATIDNVEVKMPAAILVIYGNPKEMAEFIKENPESAYDLPFRILIYRNDAGEVWIMYQDFASFGQQHFLPDNKHLLPKYDKLLQGFKKKLEEAQIKKVKENE